LVVSINVADRPAKSKATEPAEVGWGKGSLIYTRLNGSGNEAPAPNALFFSSLVVSVVAFFRSLLEPQLDVKVDTAQSSWNWSIRPRAA
jgi:hypothetical protein